MRKLVTSAFAFLVLICCSTAAVAINPDEVLDDPVLEQRARALSAEIRCLVCQNQSIDDSDAQLARDLRVLVREKLVEGLTDAEVLDFLVARYGEFVLLKPRFNTGTLVLWIAPLALLLIAGILIILRARKPIDQSGKTAVLTEVEREALDRLIDKRD